jgi:hypothetical protein
MMLVQNVQPRSFAVASRYSAQVLRFVICKFRMVTDFLGDGVLMYSSDYPHAESRFPESTSKVLEWKFLGDEVLRKMLWRCFGEPWKVFGNAGDSRLFPCRSFLLISCDLFA